MAQDRGVTVWHVADKGSDWFSPSESSFMINDRVDHLATSASASNATPPPTWSTAIIPHSKGGASTIDNVQLLCRRCDLAKSDRI